MENDLKFRKNQKIVTKSEYDHVFKKGIKINGYFLKIYVLKHEEEQQVGIIISRRIKGSVKRNRYKRLIREFYRLNQNKISAGTRFVVVVYKEIKPDTYNVVEREIAGLLEKAEKIAK
jgi:ribonuclease P protein component